MRKTYTIIGIAGVVLLVAGFMYFSFGGASPDIQKVISDDGQAELTIPRNALPEGVSIKDISITNVSVDDTTIAYEFKPDGTAFSADLTFKATFKNKDNVIPVPFIMSKENGIELVSGAEITLNLTKNETTLSMPMAHFSGVAISLSPSATFFKATVEAPAQVYIEDIVTTKITLNNTADVVALDYGITSPWHGTLNRAGSRIVRDSVKVEGRVVGNTRIFAPNREFDNRPPLTAFTGETLTVESSDYRCATLGIGDVRFWFDFRYEGEALNLILEGPFGQNSRVESSLGMKSVRVKLFAYKEIECVARPSVLDVTGVSGISESESKAVGDILDEVPSTNAPATPPPATKSPGSIKVCGLPGGPPCPKR